MSDQTMRVIKRVTGKSVSLTGKAEAQALSDAPLPEKPVTLDVTLLANGCDGFVMRYAAKDAALAGDSWHANLGEAELQANRLFGLRRSDWQNEPAPVPTTPQRKASPNIPRNPPERNRR
jgi:hypothetical protein